MWRDIMRVAAAEHGIFIVYAGLVGFEGGKGFTGASRLMGPFGDLRVEAPFDGAAIVRTTISLADVNIALMARERMIVLFDQSAKFDGLPVGTGNKSERLLGYFTWHADDSPPINPIGDLFKVQVWQLARHVGVPSPIVDKPATADLIRGQTDEVDLGISYPRADSILNRLLQGYREEEIIASGFTPAEVRLVVGRVNSTHWKRHLPTTAMISTTAINEFYLRPVDY
jgi:NAD+ synthetase